VDQSWKDGLSCRFNRRVRRRVQGRGMTFFNHLDDLAVLQVYIGSIQELTVADKNSSVMNPPVVVADQLSKRNRLTCSIRSGIGLPHSKDNKWRQNGGHPCFRSLAQPVFLRPAEDIE